MVIQNEPFSYLNFRALLLFSSGVAAQAVRIIADALFGMFLLHLSLVVTGKTSPASQAGGVAVPAGVCILMVHRKAVRVIVTRWQPGAGAMARLAIGAEHSSMNARF